MRLSALICAVSLALTSPVWPQLAAAQDDLDFVFTDVEGHMLLRFAGAGPGGISADQMDEVVNVSLSTMVHDRLRADALFTAEPVDSQWAESLTPELRRHVSETGPDFSSLDVECRSSTCRLVLEHPTGRNIVRHQDLMGDVQLVIEAFIEAHPASFDPVFLITAYTQERETPNIKAFLRRATSGS